MARKPKSEASVLHAEVVGAVPTRATKSEQCPFCGTWCHDKSPGICSSEEQASKCAWNVKPQPVRSFRKIGDVE